VRKLPIFNYFSPQSMDEAIKILREKEGKIRPFAGGTDLFVAMKEKGVSCENILNLKSIKGFDFIRESNGNIEIGALATIRSIETSELLESRVPFLSAAAGRLGSIQIRNMATLGGNICNASPAAETAPALLALEASVEIVGDEKQKIVSLEDFFIGPGLTVLKEKELVTKFIIPPMPEDSAGVYFKHSPRQAMDIATVSVCCLLTLDSDRKRCIDSKIVLGAVAPKPIRATMAEAMVNRKEISEKEIERAGEAASQEAKPIADIRASAEYRTEMVKVFVRKGIREVLRKLKSQ
jgi:CO/xanthine dehydrogenase FAD-binding subunit